MKHILFITCLLYAVGCFSQKNNIYGTYYSNFQYLGNVKCILGLDSNNTFYYYENVDEGDVTSECLSSGKFSITGDSIRFISVYDSSLSVGKYRDINFIDFSGTKMRIAHAELQVSGLPKIARDGSPLQVFSKFDFLKLDSIKAIAFTQTDINDILITKQRLCRRSFSDDSVRETFYIADEKYNNFLSYLAGTRFFALKNNNKSRSSVMSGCLELYFPRYHVSLCGNYFSQAMYNLLFIEITK